MHSGAPTGSSNMSLDECGGRVCVCVFTIFGGDVADDVDFVHGNLPVGFLFAETQSPALLSAAGGTLNTQKRGALEAQDTHTHRKCFLRPELDGTE